MKPMSIARKYGSKIAAASVAAAALPSFAAGGPIDSIFAAIDLSTVAASVIALGVLVIGVTMAFKGVDLGKRGVKKV